MMRNKQCDWKQCIKPWKRGWLRFSKLNAWFFVHGKMKMPRSCMNSAKIRTSAKSWLASAQRCAGKSWNHSNYTEWSADLCDLSQRWAWTARSHFINGNAFGESGKAESKGNGILDRQALLGKRICCRSRKSADRLWFWKAESGCRLVRSLCWKREIEAGSGETWLYIFRRTQKRTSPSFRRNQRSDWKPYDKKTVGVFESREVRYLRRTKNKAVWTQKCTFLLWLLHDRL